MNIIEIINQIEADKRRNNKVPTYAIIKEVKDIAFIQGISGTKVDSELEQLVMANKIYMGDTINSKFIKVL